MGRQSVFPQQPAPTRQLCATCAQHGFCCTDQCAKKQYLVFFKSKLNLTLCSCPAQEGTLGLMANSLCHYFRAPSRLGFPGGSAGEESTYNSGDVGSIPGLGRSPGEGKGYPLQYSGLENSMDCTVHRVTNSWT